MTLDLTFEQERLLDQAVKAGVIRAPGEVLELGIETIRRRLEEGAWSQSADNAEEWLRQFHSWLETHSANSPLLSDDAISRESIYGTRGK